MEWDRGWDGRSAQIFHLNYPGGTKHINDSTEHYLEKLGENDGIKDSTEYTVSLYAENYKGSSLTVTKTTTTKGESVLRTFTLFVGNFSKNI